MERNTATAPSSLINVYSIGWSDVPDHYLKLKGYVFDIETLGKDADRTTAQWPVFGGDGEGDTEALRARACKTCGPCSCRTHHFV